MRTTPEEAAHLSAHVDLEQITLAVDAAEIVAPQAIRHLKRGTGIDLLHIASAMFEAGKLEGIRTERNRRRA